MATFVSPIDVSGFEIQNFRLQNLAADPSNAEGKPYWNTVAKEIRVYNGTSWVPLAAGSPPDATTSTKGIVQLAGDLAGTATSPQIAAGVITNTEIATGAAIAYSKLNLTGAILNADLAGSIALSKLATDPLARANHTGTQLASTISDFNTAVRTNRLDQMAAPTAAVSMGGYKLTNLADGTVAQDAVTKAQLDAAQSGLDVKASVRVATTANITIATALNSGDSIDGVTLADGDRVLVKDQSSKAENGIWVVGASPARATDADAAGELSGGTFVFVEEGTQQDTAWAITTNGSITPGTTPHDWAIFSRAGELAAGDGMTKTAGVLAVGAGYGLDVQADVVDVDPTEINLNEWAAPDGAVAMNSQKLTGLANGTADTDSAAIGQIKTGIGTYKENCGTNATWVVTHNLGTLDVQVEVVRVSDGATVIPDIARTSTNVVTITLGSTPTAGQYRVLIRTV